VHGRYGVEMHLKDCNVKMWLGPVITIMKVGFHKDGGYHDYLSDYHLLKKDTVPSNYLI
jgi:hypothetical protein